MFSFNFSQNLDRKRWMVILMLSVFVKIHIRNNYYILIDRISSPESFGFRAVPLQRLFS